MIKYHVDSQSICSHMETSSKMTSAPQTIGNKLIDELNTACMKVNVTPLEIARLNKKARDLVKVDPVEGYTVLGAIACIQYDVDGMKSNHLKALRLAPTDYFAINNYISSLGRTWLLLEQFDFLQSQINANNMLENALLKSVLNRVVLGIYDEAMEYIERYLSLHEGEVMGDDLSDVSDAYNLFQSFDIDFVEVMKYVDIMNKVLLSRKISLGYVTHFITPENELVRNIAIDTDTSGCLISELNEELIELLIEQDFSDKFVSIFSGRFIKCD